MIYRIMSFIVVYIVLMGILLFFNAKYNNPTHYDERQEKYRANAYKYAFFTIIMLLLGYILFDCIVGIILPRFILSNLLICMMVISAMVFGFYCIMHDCFFFIEQTTKKNIAMCLGISIIEIILFIKNLFKLFNGLNQVVMAELVVNGLLAFMFLVFTIMIYKKKAECEE